MNASECANQRSMLMFWEGIPLKTNGRRNVFGLLWPVLKRKYLAGAVDVSESWVGETSQAGELWTTVTSGV